jgi:hypothetical protein
MFAFFIGRPPTRQMKKAQALMEKTEFYLFESSDPVAQYLERSLAAVRATISVLAVTEGNGTGPFARICFNRMMYAVYERTYVWLIEHWGMSEEVLAAKYPNMVKRMQEEDDDIRRHPYYCQANWSSGQVRELPNLLGEFLHKGRLGQVIDKVLHLTPK